MVKSLKLILLLLCSISFFVHASDNDKRESQLFSVNVQYDIVNFTMNYEVLSRSPGEMIDVRKQLLYSKMNSALKKWVKQNLIIAEGYSYSFYFNEKPLTVQTYVEYLLSNDPKKIIVIQ